MCTVAGCGKRFTEYSSLYKHHVVHTHSKPYVCNHCGKTYRQTSTLAMHKRTAHGEDVTAESEAQLYHENQASGMINECQDIYVLTAYYKCTCIFCLKLPLAIEYPDYRSFSIHLLPSPEGDMKICSTQIIHVAEGDMNFLGWTNLHVSRLTGQLIVYFTES